MASKCLPEEGAACLFSDMDPFVMLQTKVNSGMGLDNWRERSEGSWTVSASNGVDIPADILFELCLRGLGLAILCHAWLRPSSDEKVQDSVTHIRSINIWITYVGIFIFMVINGALMSLSFDAGMGIGGVDMFGSVAGVTYVSMVVGYLCTHMIMRQSQTFKRNFISSCLFGMSMLTLVTSIVLSPICAHVWVGARWFLLCAARILLGLITSGMVTQRMMIQSILPAADNIRFNTYFTIAVALGVGGGPAVSSFLSWVFACDDANSQAVVPLRAMSSISFVVASLWYAWTPVCLQVFLDAKNTDDTKAAMEQSKSSIGEPKCLPRCQKIWVTALILGTIRAMIIPTSEVATALLLEQYGLTTSQIGYVMGAVLTLGLPIIPIIDRIRSEAHLSSTTSLLLYIIICGMTAPLLFIRAGTFLNQHFEVSRWKILAIAEAFIFPASYAMSGLADALAMGNSEADSFCSQENYLIVSGILQTSFALAFSPRLARHLVLTGGQNAYAAFLSLIIGLALIKTFALWNQVRQRPKSFQS